MRVGAVEADDLVTGRSGDRRSTMYPLRPGLTKRNPDPRASSNWCQAMRILQGNCDRESARPPVGFLPLPQERRPPVVVRAQLFIPSLLVIGLTGCSDPTGIDPLPDLDPVTSWNLVVQEADEKFIDVWGSSAEDVFVVSAEQHMILHYDGIGWSRMASGQGGHFWAVGGTSSDNVFAWFFGGRVMHYDGSVWSEMVNETGHSMRDIWAASPNDVFSVGIYGTIMRYDGASWSMMITGSRDGEWTRLMGVWGTSANDVFAVGSAGRIEHYDGTGWTPMSSGTDAYLRDVWGTSSSDVFAVGFDGTILHYDGTVWSEMTSGTYPSLEGVWGTSARDVYAVGSEGVILRYDGSQWSEMASGTTESLKAVWGTPCGDIYVVGWGGTILRGQR